MTTQKASGNKKKNTTQSTSKQTGSVRKNLASSGTKSNTSAKNGSVSSRGGKTASKNSGSASRSSGTTSRNSNSSSRSANSASRNSGSSARGGYSTSKSSGSTSRNTGSGSSGRKAGSDSSRNQQTLNFNEPRISEAIKNEIIMVVVSLISLLLILSYLNLCGAFGRFMNSILFGLMGVFTYAFPFVLFFLVAFSLANKGSTLARLKIISGTAIVVFLTSLIQLLSDYDPAMSIWSYYTKSAAGRSGGGFIGALICTPLNQLFGKLATTIILIAFILIFFMILSGKALLSYFGRKSSESFKKNRERYQLRKQEFSEMEDMEAGLYLQNRREARIVTLAPAEEGEQEFEAAEEEPEKHLGFLDFLKLKGSKNSVVPHEAAQDEDDDYDNEIIDSSETKAPLAFETFDSLDDFNVEEIKPVIQSFPLNDTPQKYAKDTPSIYEEELNRKFKRNEVIRKNPEDEEIFETKEQSTVHGIFDGPDIYTDSSFQSNKAVPTFDSFDAFHENADPVMGDTGFSERSMEKGNLGAKSTADKEPFTESDYSKNSENHTVTTLDNTTEDELQIDQTPVEKVYKFPPVSLLARPKGRTTGMSRQEMDSTANKLISTLNSFGVQVKLLNVSCGPSVTRYELQPEQGVKVSKITSLSDDIKLNLAAADVRIEAPIPGKAAIGIEVPNKENVSVMIRDLIDSKEFAEHHSDIVFAVGRDIGGQIIVSDIAKMPHLLIAGATGSGKSVCINTLIASILYKSSPSDVRLMMIDPKVVELSSYNGIPHLLIPVVTDPKKAAAALNWAVMEMTDRYNKFAEMHVRDLKGYNERIKEEPYCTDEKYHKLPQIVIIVDELADLMMVASNEVEDAICRLAQMARAAGLHLVIATQRPSVNVITGVIKANVPSRIAFAVSSAVDSRTIIDGGGAEKLLGKGDMLFYPSGYPKPIRVQGAFISDKEVSAIVDFIKEQNLEPSYSEEVSNHIKNSNSSGGSVNDSIAPNSKDEYFYEAARFIIEKDKASIGMLQRVYRIGFNRAARIMEQLADAGVVGEEEGTKPRKILMSMEEFEAFMEENA